MKTWAWRIRRMTRQSSLPWLGVLGLALFAAGFQWFAVQPAERELESLAQTAAGLQARSTFGDGRGARRDPRLQLTSFYAGFPAVASAPNWLERIHASAQANRLELMQGDYRIVQAGQEGLARYQITLPLKGAYPDIRSFINTVLSEMPVASLDNVAFERQKIGDTAVQVTLRLTFYLRSGG